MLAALDNSMHIDRHELTFTMSCCINVGIWVGLYPVINTSSTPSFKWCRQSCSWILGLRKEMICYPNRNHVR